MQYRVRIGQREAIMDIKPGRGSYTQIELDGRVLSADLCRVGINPVYSLLLDGKSYQFFIQEEDGTTVVVIDGQMYPARVARGDAAAVAPPASFAAPEAQRIVAPMPGLIVQVLVAVGDQVERQAPVIVVESMKMNNQLRAQAGGTVKAVNVQQGQRVERGQVLVVIE